MYAMLTNQEILLNSLILTTLMYLFSFLNSHIFGDKLSHPVSFFIGGLIGSSIIFFLIRALFPNLYMVNFRHPVFFVSAAATYLIITAIRYRRMKK